MYSLKNQGTVRFAKEVNTCIQEKHIKLIKCDVKDIML